MLFEHRNIHRILRSKLFIWPPNTSILPSQLLLYIGYCVITTFIILPQILIPDFTRIFQSSCLFLVNFFTSWDLKHNQTHFQVRIWKTSQKHYRNEALIGNKMALHNFEIKWCLPFLAKFAEEMLMLVCHSSSFRRKLLGSFW